MRLVFEGWRFLPHSYGVVDQFLCLALLGRPNVELFHRDIPYYDSATRSGAEQLGDEQAARRLAQIPAPPPDLIADATVRFFVPLDLSAARAGQTLDSNSSTQRHAGETAGRTLIFATAEFGLPDPRMAGATSVRAFNRQDNVALLTPSEWSRSGLIRGGFDPDKIIVVPLGFDPQLFRPADAAAREALRQRLGWHHDFVFLNVGALTANKGAYLLLKAFAAVTDKFPRARLILKGLDQLYRSRSSLDEYRQALSAGEWARIEPRLTYLGNTMTYVETAELYQAADAYVSPYRAEGFNIPVLEAAACGLPVVCTAGGPTDEFTDDSFALRIASRWTSERVDGLPGAHVLAPAEAHLVAQMERLLSDAGLTADCRRAGPVYVGARFTWKHIADRLLTVLGDPQARCWQPRSSGRSILLAPEARPQDRDRHAQALNYYQSGDRERAARLCRETLHDDPLQPDAIYLLGVLALDAGQTEKALLHFHQAVMLRPDSASFHNALGEVYRGMGRLDEAIDQYREALELDPSFAASHNALGNVWLDRGEPGKAEASFRSALAGNPNYERAHLNLGRALHVQGDLEGAAAAFNAALQLRPDYAIAHNNLGAVLLAQGDPEQAVRHYRRALQIDPEYPEAHFNLGNALRAQGSPGAAIPHFQKAIRLRPTYTRAHAQLGQALIDIGQVAASVDALRAVIKLDAADAAGYFHLADILSLLGSVDEALVLYNHALQLRPGYCECFAHRFQLKEQQCDWRDRSAELSRLFTDTFQEVDAGKPSPLHPVHAMSLPLTAAQHLAIAGSHAAGYERSASRDSRQGRASAVRAGRLKVAYLSRDFYDHPVAHQVQGLFGLHDRGQFEIHAYSFGPDDSSTYRQRIVRDCECFHDVASQSVPELEERIRADGIHILVDLMGYTGLARTACVARRPAPIQVSWLGYASTMGADFIDYVIGDPVLIPPEQADAYSEAVVRLPNSFMIADRDQPVGAAAGSRADQGLPAKGMVFCCFNGAHKISPDIFDIWMRLLAQVPGSVAWLSVRNAAAQANLRREAEARGISPDRLVFASHTRSKADHLARHRLADLFLDTHYYNAHATACDALWAGLPVLTCPGAAFASRVGASLVSAAGLPEMIAPDLQAYERRALELASKPDMLHLLRQRLAARRTTAALFDTPRFVRDLERAYEVMWERHASGLPPRAIFSSMTPRERGEIGEIFII